MGCDDDFNRESWASHLKSEKINKWQFTKRLDGRLEWVCEHGVGHGNHIHGCCENHCCSREDYPGKQIKLHIGPGKRNWPGWINIDIANFPHIHYHDIKRLPFKDNSVDLIYSSHMIPYFDREEIIPILQEWKRILKPSGILRLAVTNFEMVVKLYNSDRYKLQSFLGPLFGRIDVNGDKIYHKTVYDYDSLKKLLEDCGFSNVRWWDWKQVDHGKWDDHSQAFLPKMDKENGFLISLNMEGEK